MSLLNRFCEKNHKNRDIAKVAKILLTSKFFQKKYKLLTFQKGIRIRCSPMPCPKIQKTKNLPFSFGVSETFTTFALRN